jgi:hypothetical protein
MCDSVWSILTIVPRVLPLILPVARVPGPEQGDRSQAAQAPSRERVIRDGKRGFRVVSGRRGYHEPLALFSGPLARVGTDQAVSRARLTIVQLMRQKPCCQRCRDLSLAAALYVNPLFAGGFH